MSDFRFNQSRRINPPSLSVSDDEIVRQVDKDTANMPPGVLARMFAGISSNISEMAQRQRGTGESLSDDLLEYQQRANSTIMEVKRAEQVKKERERQERIMAFAAKQRALKQATHTEQPEQQQPEPAHAAAVQNNLHNVDTNELREYFDSKFEELNSNLRAINEQLFQILASNSWQETWTLADSYVEATEATNSNEELSSLFEGSK